jgi:PleD family two-component response regulator
MFAAPKAETMAELTPRDDDKKRVSEILKRVDQLIKTQDYESATREIEHAKSIDPRNVYIEAYHERLLSLVEREKKDRDAAEVRRRAEEEERKQREEERRKRDEQQRKEELDRLHRQNEERKRKEHDERQEQEEARKQPTALASSKQPAKVFVIDDDEKLLNIVKQVIEDEGFVVQAFLTSDEAYRVLKTETPDIILSDINLETSTMGGFSFFEKIREMEHLHEVPFVFLSGLSDEVLVRTGKEMGIDDFLTKPFSPQSLLATIKGKIKRYRQMKSHRKNS